MRGESLKWLKGRDSSAPLMKQKRTKEIKSSHKDRPKKNKKKLDQTKNINAPSFAIKTITH